MIHVLPISSPTDLDQAFAIRREVFVMEQQVPEVEEYDEFETISRHFLALFLDKKGVSRPCGTARWRRTSKGVKLERFAVLKAYRGKGVGKALVKSVLDDVFSLQPEPIESIYLHAQVSALALIYICIKQPDDFGVYRSSESSWDLWVIDRLLKFE